MNFEETLNQYRRITYHATTDSRITSVDETVQFINERGFTFFWPVQGINLPSLWVAAAGDRPVADEHDDPGHVTWGWKDQLLDKKRVFYSRFLHRKNTFISLEFLPYFYALSPNYGDPENDYLEEYNQGLLTQEAKSVYEALLTKGPMDTIALRQAARLANPSNKSRFQKALDDLQVALRVLPVGISQAGGWHYSFILDIVPRYFPDLIEQTRFVSDEKAYQIILTRYFQNLGAGQKKDIVRLFGWKSDKIDKLISLLIDDGILFDHSTHTELPEDWIAHKDFFNHQN